MQKFIAILAILLAAGLTQAQTPTAVLVEGQPLPGGGGSSLISSINNSAVNHVGGYAFTVNTLDDGATISRIWGSASGSAGAPIFAEGVFGQYQQNSFESFFGFSNAGLSAYSPSCTDLDTGETGLDAVWVDDLLVAIEGQPVPTLPGFFSSFNSRPGMLADGRPYWVGGFTDTMGGATQNRALFMGYDAQVLLKGGDLLPGLNWPLVTSGFDFDVRMSAGGTHYILMAQLDTGSTSDDGYMVFDGEALQIAGTFVSESEAVPPEAGGLDGELWDNFDFLGVTEDGDYLVTGDTNHGAALDEFVLVNGQIVLREGTVLGDYTLYGSIEGAFMNEQGDWAVIWDADDPTGTNIEVLILNGEILFKEGDAVDFDGDGIADPDVTLTDFTGISSLTLSERNGNDQVMLAFTADVEAPGRGRMPADELPADLEMAGLEGLPQMPRGDRLEVECGFLMEVIAPTDAPEVSAIGHRLHANYPNPFNPKTRISFHLERDANLSLDLYTVDGRHVRRLFEGELAAGEHGFDWNGRDAEGQPLASGLYLYRLRTGDWSQTRCMLLMK